MTDADEIMRLKQALESVRHELSRDETPQECLATKDQFAALEMRIHRTYAIADKALQAEEILEDFYGS